MHYLSHPIVKFLPTTIQNRRSLEKWVGLAIPSISYPSRSSLNFDFLLLVTWSTILSLKHSSALVISSSSTSSTATTGTVCTMGIGAIGGAIKVADFSILNSEWWIVLVDCRLCSVYCWRADVRAIFKLGDIRFLIHIYKIWRSVFKLPRILTFSILSFSSLPDMKPP